MRKESDVVCFRLSQNSNQRLKSKYLLIRGSVVIIILEEALKFLLIMADIL